MKTNAIIRRKAKEQGVHFWQIADRLGIHDTEFSKKMRYQFDEEETERILKIIKRISEEG